MSWKSVRPTGKWFKWLGLGMATGTAGTVAVTLATPVFASDFELHPAKLPWDHLPLLAAFDHASVRRGYQVYKDVCAACHSLKYLTYRSLVDHVLTDEEAKAQAAEMQVLDGPDDDGKMFHRPGRLTDGFTAPYDNDEAARKANNGALPPDLTFITKAREDGQNYIFHLLTGYYDPPPGVHIPDGQYYNPYFTGGRLSMARALYNEMLEYEDGTTATTSQMAKDVVTFLSWSADRNHDKRKRVLFKIVIGMAIITAVVGVYKRKIWSNVKTRKLMYKNRPPPKDI